MSRVGRSPIPIPPGVEIRIKGSEVVVKGPKGELRRVFPPDMAIALKDNTVVVSRPSDEKRHCALHGLTRSLLANMVEGVTKGFEKALEIVGVGYRAQVVEKNLVLQVGYSHPVEITPVPGISFVVDKGNMVKVVGADKEAVGQTAAKIRAVHPPDSYKGKGVKYADEKLRLKPGKAGKAVAKKK